MSQLPLNAQDFFNSGSKPTYYAYPDQQGIITKVPTTGFQAPDMQIPVVNTDTNEVKYKNSTVSVSRGVSTPKQPQIRTIRSRLVTSTVQPEPVAAVLPDVKRQPVQPRTIAQSPQKPIQPTSRCKYMVKAVNKGCGCSALECNNNECPLSKILPSGGKTKLNSLNCRKESCRWFTDVQS